MKTLSPAVQAILAKRYATEAINILAVQWVDGGNTFYYADKAIGLIEIGDSGERIETNIPGNILEVTTLESVIKLDSKGQSQAISVKLSDTDGVLKDIINNHDIHARPCSIYQWFTDLPITEKFLLFQGEISSDIVWDEGDRTLTMDIITKMQDKEVGFSPEEGQFYFIPSNLIGKPWPLAFGSVQNVPAVQLQEIPQTQTTSALGIADMSLHKQLQKLAGQRNDLEWALQFYIGAALQCGLQAIDAEMDGRPQDAEMWRQKQKEMEGYIAQINASLYSLKEENKSLVSIQTAQMAYQKAKFGVTNPYLYQSGAQLVLNIGGYKYYGKFNGDDFEVDTVLDPNYMEGKPGPYGFTFIEAGSTVKLESEINITYVANLLPSTVTQVRAYKNVQGYRYMAVVPSAYYRVEQVDMGAYTVTVLIFPRSLSSYGVGATATDEGWEDDIYVTMNSTIGPNTVDIMEWLINKYTTLTYDSVSFNYVKSKLENYPSHFALLDRRNIIELLEDIAFQARCAIWITNGKFYLKYLSEECNAVDTITEDDIDAGSLKVLTTKSEELVTKLTAKWTDDYSKVENNTIVLRHNIKKYGLRERDIDFFIYNIEELVLKSATYWLIRLSNVWKQITFNTYTNKLHLETFDTVTFDFASDYVANSDVKGLITALSYDTAEKSLAVEAWLPVKLGTMDPYVFAWPANTLVTDVFPTPEEINWGLAGGDGPGTGVFGNTGITQGSSNWHLGKLGDATYSSYMSDLGDRTPTDIGDTKPSPKFTSLENIAATAAPSYNYNYGDYPVSLHGPDVPVEQEVLSGAYPGIVVGQSEGVYIVNIYKNGLSNAPETVFVRQLQLAINEIIPTDTWVVVAMTLVDNGTGTKIPEYTMQVPVWL